ncbi:DNA translocase FtsK [Patescibacteria group bacterium]|nr:DNA translocase FtsK [Patescibacteria group bacterium]MCL5009993.1 DNA translocase FtsK [Patescibacteria group bacterium]
MARKRSYRRKSFKLRLKNETIYTIFAIGLILSSVLAFLSFLPSGSNFLFLNSFLDKKFGFLSILLPFVLLFFAFLFLRLKIFLSQPNVALGFLLFFISLIGISRSGSMGSQLFFFLSSFLTDIGSKFVFAGGIVVGVIVFFDTSFDELLGMIILAKDNVYRFFPKRIFSVFKTKKPLIVNSKSIAIKGGSRDIANMSSAQTVALPSRKEPHQETPNLSEKLVSNALTGSLMWEYPSLNLLDDNPGKKADRGDVKRIATIIERTLQSFGIEARVVEVNLGPAVTQYALEIALGTKVSKITSLANDLALATEAPTGQIRIEAPIPGRNLVGIEIPNRSLEVVSLKTMLSSTAMRKNKSKLTFALGLDVSGNPFVADIAKMPHVLIAGTTGSGKSVMINSVISSILFRASPSEVKLILIDPKRVELTTYNGIPHLLTPVIVETDQILSSLKWAMKQMDERYKIFAEAGVRNIDSYNELSGFQALPYIVIVIDELADLMAFAPVEVEDAIARLAQMARATGIHLVLSTQRPSVNVITGLIKANIPCRIAFNVSSMIDSRVIIDMPGAEKLLGRGDMLYIPPDQAKPTRIQGTFVSDKEVKRIADYLRTKAPHVEYTEEVVRQQVSLKKGNMITGSDGKDPLFEEAVRIVCQHDRASSSLLQRRLSIGYARAARILDQLEDAGIVGPGEGAKPRDVMIKNPEQFLQNPQEIN